MSPNPTMPRVLPTPAADLRVLAKRAERTKYEDDLARQIAVCRLPEPEREYVFGGIDGHRRWRFDFAWPDRMLAAEVDGATWTAGRHARGSGIEGDSVKYSEAAVCYWRVLRFTAAMVEDGRARVYLELALKEPA